MLIGGITKEFQHPHFSKESQTLVSSSACGSHDCAQPTGLAIMGIILVSPNAYVCSYVSSLGYVSVLLMGCIPCYT